MATTTTTPKKPKNKHIAIRIEDDLHERLAEIAAWLCERSIGVIPTLTLAGRAALLEGVAVLEARMAAAKTTKGRKVRRG